MNKSTELKLVVAAAALLVGTTAVFSKDQIRTYSVPKGHPTVQKSAMADTGGIDVNSSPIQWVTPKGWKELQPTSIRLGNFVIAGKDGAKAEVTITSFPGDVGGELSNVNRWRGELALPPVTDKEISSKPVKVGSDTAKLYDFTSGQGRTVVASLPRNGSTWFFKLRGDKDVVNGAVDTFLGFLKTIRFEAKGRAESAGVLPADPHANVDLGSNPHATVPDGANPHANLGNGAADPHAGIAGAPPLNAGDTEKTEEPKWQIPSNWKEKQAGMMVLKSFSVSNDGKEAAVAISQFPGDVGGTFANVNRWRAQMGLPPVPKDELPNVTSTLDVENGGKGTVVDIKGTDGKTGKPARLVAVAVPHAGDTWFYKLIGDEGVVGHEKDAFLKFVQNVRYP